MRADDGSILFVCVGNICRSPMAAALLQSRLGNSSRVESAGIFGLSGHGASANAITIAEENGLDIRDHRARHVREIDLDRFRRVIALTPAIARVLRDEYAVPEQKISELDVEDPYGADLGTYRRCFEEIEEQLEILALSPAED